MNRCWVLGIEMAAGLQAQPRDCSVDVYVITGVAMPSGMLLDARLRATRMFRVVGVNLRGWAGRVMIQTTPAAPPLVTRSRLTPWPTPCPIRTAVPASTFSSTVRAHEIGHVLEQMQRHSESAVMKARWSAEDYQRMERNPLPFAPEDVELIREGLLKRATDAGTERCLGIPPLPGCPQKQAPRRGTASG